MPPSLCFTLHFPENKPLSSCIAKNPFTFQCPWTALRPAPCSVARTVYFYFRLSNPSSIAVVTSSAALSHLPPNIFDHITLFYAATIVHHCIDRAVAAGLMEIDFPSTIVEEKMSSPRRGEMLRGWWMCFCFSAAPTREDNEQRIMHQFWLIANGKSHERWMCVIWDDEELDFILGIGKVGGCGD